MKAAWVCSLVVAVAMALGVSAIPDDKPSSARSPRFDAIKSLAGDWVELGKDGKLTDKIVSSFRVTAAGSAVQETLLPGSDHEMVTMYHLDGPDLVLTHYCAMGNQPTLKAEPSDDPSRIVFKFIGGTNLKPGVDQYMNFAEFTIDGKDRLKAHWMACKEGKACHDVTFNLARKPR
jgi:hypothetical protein